LTPTSLRPHITKGQVPPETGGQDPPEPTGHIYKETKSNKNKIKNIKKEFTAFNIILENIPKEKQTKALLRAIDKFLDHRAEIKRKMSSAACQRLGIKLSRYTPDISIAALYQSIESGWTGVFPEAVNKIKDKKESKIVPDRSLEAWAKIILGDRYKSQDSDGTKIALGLRAIRDWYDDKQKDRPTFKVAPERFATEFYSYCNWKLVPYSDAVLKRYADWLKKQNWIEEIQPGFFSPDSKMFQRFLRQWQKDVGVNFFTGGSL
jgi:hypothetical protein